MLALGLGFLSILKPLLAPLLQAAALSVAGVLAARAHRTPTDLDRAQHISLIANEAAALIVMQNPNATWDDALAKLIRQLSEAAGLPTSNAEVIRRAAAAALKEHGVEPPK